MRRISENRLRDVERRAPKPFVPLTLTVTAFEPASADGCGGPPVCVGIAEVARTRRDGPPIVILFDPPALDLLAVDLGALSDAEIAALAERGDAQVNKT